MEKEQQKEWFKFRKAAVELVRAGGQPFGTKRLIQLLILPTFESTVGYEICGPATPKYNNWLAVMTRWRFDLDVAKFSNPVERLKHPYPLHPTIERATIHTTAGVVETALARFRSLTVPVSSSRDILGLDGTSYEVVLGDFWTSSRFHWWGEAPTEWKPIGTAFQEVLPQLEALFAETSLGS